MVCVGRAFVAVSVVFLSMPRLPLTVWLLLRWGTAAAAVRTLGPFESVATRATRQPYTAALIVPTGIGAAIGGYAGDAMPVARAFTAVADRVITHPNVLNGATMYWPHDSLQYVEGFAFDEFASGRWGLRPVVSQRVGLLLDSGIEPELRLRHLQAADAARATLGVCVTAHATTDEPLGVEIQMSPAGACVALGTGLVSRTPIAVCTSLMSRVSCRSAPPTPALANSMARHGVSRV